MPTASVTQLKPSRAGSILSECQKLASSRLPEALKFVLNQADDALFELANKADSSSRQNMYFDAMRDLRLKREEFEQRFERSFTESFTASIAAAQTAMPGEDAGFSGELSLVEMEDVELGLAVTNFGESLRTRCRDELYGLDQRIAVLIGVRPLDGERNPLGPNAIGEALREACLVLESDVEIKLTLLKLFERFASSEVHEIYRQLNRLLIEHDIIVDLKGETGISKTPRNRTRVIIESDNESGEATGDDVFSTLEQLMSRPIGANPGLGMGGVAGLGISMRATGSPTAPSAAAAGTVSAPLNSPTSGTGFYAGGAPLVQGLTELQRGASNHAAWQAIDQEAVSAGNVNVLHAIRSSGSFEGADPAEHLTLEIVSLLFDYVLDDPAIPDALKALIGRLQIPVLKVALLDRDVFSKKQHPARRLLDELAKASIGWSEGLRQQDELYEQVEWVVRTIVDDFEDDVTVFSKVLDAFVEFVESESKQAAERAEASSRSLHTKEQIIRAKMDVDDEIKRRLDGQEIREFIRNFILDYWRQLLIVTTMEGDEGENKRATLLDCLDELIWSSQPKPTSAERKELMARLPPLVKALKNGMQELEMASADQSRFLSMLASVHVASVRSDEEVSVAEQRLAEAQARINARRVAADAKIAARRQGNDGAVDFAVDVDEREVSEPLAAEAEATPEATPTPAAPVDDMPARAYDDPASEEFIKKGLERIFEQKETGPVELDIDFSVFGDEEETVDEGDVTVDGSLAPVGGISLVECSDQVATLDLGDWLELTDADGSSSRVRFTWISPDSGRYLFTTRAGEKALDSTMMDLAALLQAGSAKIIKSEPDPLFERALGALIEKLEATPEAIQA